MHYSPIMQYSPVTQCLKLSDAPKWNLADIPITDNGSEISADTDSRSDIQLSSNFYLSVHNFKILWSIFP